MQIKEIRKLTGLSQAKFAEKYCVSKRNIENWETGKRKPPDHIPYLLERVVTLEKRNMELENIIKQYEEKNC